MQVSYIYKYKLITTTTVMLIVTLYHVIGVPGPLAGLHLTFLDPSSVYNWSDSPSTPT